MARSRTNPAMRLRKIPAATRKACRPTPAWGVAAVGACGEFGAVTIGFVPCSLVYK